MAVLKTNYVDDVLNTSVNTQRKYIQTNNADGTISLSDATSYTQEGSTFGAADINATNQEVNALNENLGGFMFRVNEDGTEQKSIDGGETWTNFSKGTVKELLWVNPSPTSAFAAQTISLDLSEYEQVIIETLDGNGAGTGITYFDIPTTNWKLLSVGSKGTTWLDLTRLAKVSIDGVTFSDRGSGKNLAYGIPQKIYGLKQGIHSSGADIITDGATGLFTVNGSYTNIDLDKNSYYLLIGYGQNQWVDTLSILGGVIIAGLPSPNNGSYYYSYIVKTGNETLSAKVNSNVSCQFNYKKIGTAY